MKDSEPHVIHTDGGARGNPGPAAYAFTIERAGDDPVEEKVYLGTTTNNVAEYTGLVKALEKAREIGARRVVVHSDSELMVKQLNGQYKVKNEGLLPLYQQAVALRRGFDSFEIKHVRREFNKHADRLCNEALDDPDGHRPVPTFGAKPAPAAAPKPAADPLAATRADAIALLKRHAETWAEGDADDPDPAEVWEELWRLLQKAGVIIPKR